MRFPVTVSFVCAPLALLLTFGSPPAAAQQTQKWVTTWAASSQGPYPAGYPSLQPDDLRLAFPSPELGASDQTFRLIVQPDIWGERARLRFSNAFGTKLITFDHIFAGLQMSSATVMPGTNRSVTFGGRSNLILPPGAVAWSDPVTLPFVHGSGADLAGRKLAVSFHVAGESGPMTWHADALTTSYLTAPQAGAVSQAEDETPFRLSTTSWFFLDAVDVLAPADTRLVVAFGDSITDGKGSTFNGDDRWSNDLARRLHAAYGSRVAVVNAGIAGNQIAAPAEYSPQRPSPGGPAAGQRVERDVLSLSGVSTVIWLEGINDFRQNDGAVLETVEGAMRDVVARARTRLPDVQILGATLPGGTTTPHGSGLDANRQGLNDFVRSARLFDGVVDFDKATVDPQTGSIPAEFVAENMSGEPASDPNRAGHLAMANAVDLHRIMPLQSISQMQQIQMQVQSPPIPPAPPPKPAMLETRPPPKQPLRHWPPPIHPIAAAPAATTASAPPAAAAAATATVVNRPPYARPNECWTEDGYGRWSPCGTAGGGGGGGGE